MIIQDPPKESYISLSLIEKIEELRKKEIESKKKEDLSKKRNEREKILQSNRIRNKKKKLKEILENCAVDIKIIQDELEENMLSIDSIIAQVKNLSNDFYKHKQQYDKHKQQYEQQYKETNKNISSFEKKIYFSDKRQDRLENYVKLIKPVVTKEENKEENKDEIKKDKDI